MLLAPPNGPTEASKLQLAQKVRLGDEVIFFSLCRFLPLYRIFSDAPYPDTCLTPRHLPSYPKPSQIFSLGLLQSSSRSFSRYFVKIITCIHTVLFAFLVQCWQNTVIEMTLGEYMIMKLKLRNPMNPNLHDAEISLQKKQDTDISLGIICALPCFHTVGIGSWCTYAISPSLHDFTSCSLPTKYGPMR